MSQTYTYDFSSGGDFPNDAVDCGALYQEVSDSGDIEKTLEDVYDDTTAEECYVQFTTALSTAEEDALDAIVAAHQGEPASSYAFRATSTMVQDAKSISGTSWGDLGGVSTSVGFFISDMDKAVARIVGEIKTDGTCELRVVNESDTMLHSSSFQFDDTSGSWVKFQEYADGNPSSSFHTYRLQGKRVGASSSEVRFVSMSLLEKI